MRMVQCDMCKKMLRVGEGHYNIVASFAYGDDMIIEPPHTFEFCKDCFGKFANSLTQESQNDD